MYPRNVVCFRYIIVNTLYKGDNKQGGGGDGDYYYNDKTKQYSILVENRPGSLDISLRP